MNPHRIIHHSIYLLFAAWTWTGGVFAQPSGATGAGPALDGTPPPNAMFATDQPSSGFWVEHWFARTLEQGNPPVTARFRVNDAFAGFQKNFKDRKEVRANGMMQIPADVDVTTVRAVELYLEMWGGHAGTANKRVTVNGRTTYHLPDDGTSAHYCAHSHPSLPLRITDVIRGFNVLQFACDRGSSFWGHFIVDEACLRFELPVGHAALSAAGLTAFSASAQAAAYGETIQLSLATPAVEENDIAAVEYYGCYVGYDENGSGAGRQWHGLTKKREPVGHLGTATQPPFRVEWDVSMLPAQEDVAVRAVVRFKSERSLIYRTLLRDGLAVAHPRDIEVAILNVKELPARFWSRSDRPKSAAINLAVEPDRIERAQLHTVSWTGGAGGVKEYFKLNGRHFPVAEGHEHRTIYSIFPVDATLLRSGENTVELLSDTKEHGIEILKPGPALVVRYRKP